MAAEGLIFLLQYYCAVQIESRKVWLEANGLPVIVKCAVQVAFGIKNIAVVAKGLGVVGLDSDSLFIILQSPFEVAFTLASKAWC